MFGIELKMSASNLTKHLKRLPFPLYATLLALYNTAPHALRFCKMRKKLGFLPSRSFSTVPTQGKTLFVLGSGPSINDIGTETWKLIRENHSIGLNFWPYHEHIPTYLMFELSSDLRYKDKPTEVAEAALSRFGTLLKSRPELVTIPKIVTEIDYDREACASYIPFNVRASSHALWTFYPVARNVGELTTVLRFAERLGFFDGGHPSIAFKIRASLSLALFLGTMWGYKELVLCGIDPYRGGYFFENDARWEKGQPKQPSPANHHPHPVVASNLYSVGMNDFIRTYNKIILEPRGIKLSCLCIESKTREELEISEWSPV